MNKFILLLLALFTFENAFGQPHSDLKDSIYLLNINALYKLKVLEFYGDSFETPFYSIDFPFTNYYSDSKTLKLFFNDSKYVVNDSSFALARVEYFADKSFGSGGRGDLYELKTNMLNLEIDTFIKLDSVSDEGVFYVKINNENIKLEIGEDYSFEGHKIEKYKDYFKESEECLIDNITEYYIKNEGLISRIIKQNK